MLKPLQAPPKGDREHSFFKRIFASDLFELNDDEIELRRFLPAYRGTVELNESKT